MEDGVRDEGNSNESSNQEKVMAEVEAMLISEVEKLESLLLVDIDIDEYLSEDSYLSDYMEINEKNIIKEVKKIVEKVRDMKLEEKRKLKYLMCDVVEDVGYVHRAIKDSIDFHRYFSILEDLKAINVGLNEGLCELLHNDGVGEGDGDGDRDVDVVGLEEDVKLLLHEMKPITSLVGFDGFGKTTLARRLYNHADVVKKFNCRAWVNCRDIVGRKELLINIIRQVAANSRPKDVEKMDLEGLQNMLRQQLMGSPCFIVLDNIWRKRCLDLVAQSLPHYDYESKLLLTYGRSRIFTFKSSVEYTHYIRLLDEGNSWKLLLKTIFQLAGGNNTCAHEFPKKLERRGKRMLMKHTGGVPLAIKDVGMEWAQKRMSGSEWEEVIESQDLELRASLGALESSFYPYLKPREKSIFLHLCLFKHGTPIRGQKFVQTWYTSEGEPLSDDEEKSDVEKSDEEKSDVEKSDEEKSLLFGNVIDIDEDTVKKYLHVGAIFHKLSVKKANEECYGASHRVIYCSRDGIDCPTDQDERLVCLFFNGGGCFDDIPSYLKCFQKLRVLDFEGFGLTFIPETVGELIELKYLGLRNNYIQQLPRSLGCLKNLEVLDIALNFMVEVPDIIWEMDALVQLYMSDIFCRTPLKIDALKNLQTLTYISVDNWTYEVSGMRMMTSLLKLGIEELNENSNVSKLFASLVEMTNLECLVLRGSRFRSMPSLDKVGALSSVYKLKLDGLITMLPKPENFPPYLGHLSLVNSCFDEDPMPVLEKLSNLRYLKLQNAYTGRQMVFSDGRLPLLDHLCISELWNLRNIQVGRVYPFTTLEITSCPCLQSLPAEFVANRYIRKFEMVTTKNIAAKIKKLYLFSERPNAVVDIQP